MKVCYGQEFYEDTGNIKYEGFYYCNHYFGYGILYNKKKSFQKVIGMLIKRIVLQLYLLIY